MIHTIVRVSDDIELLKGDGNPSIVRCPDGVGAVRNVDIIIWEVG